MTERRSRSILTTFTLTVIATFAATSDAALAPAGHRIVTSAPVSDGDNHARPHATVTLLGGGGEQLWAVPGVVESHASADGRVLALVTLGHELLIAELPGSPRVVAGAYFTARTSDDGKRVVAHAIGGEGDAMLRIQRGLGIVLVEVPSLQSRLVLTGSDLYAPSFADGDRVFFGSAGGTRVASLWILDLRSDLVARITNREPDLLELFPEAAPRLAGETVIYQAEGRTVQAPLPQLTSFAPAPRFDPAVRDVAIPPATASFGYVKLRTPTTQACLYNGRPVGQYFDLDRRMGFRADWACGGLTYDGHRGTDYCQPCGNAVAAPANGFVIEWYDGCPNFGNWGNACGRGWGNHVAIVHDDGTASIEAHGKAGTVVRAGNVACGSTLMVSCSSGNSTGPHIHHENWINPNGYWDPSLAFDPYRGNCDAWDATKWRNQGTYGWLPSAACN